METESQSPPLDLPYRQSESTSQSLQTNHGSVFGTVKGSVSVSINQTSKPESSAEYLKQLGPIDPLHQRSQILARKGKLLPGSCDWVFQEDAYKQWYSRKADSAVMWIHGNPGKGKTMIVSAAIDHIAEDRDFSEDDQSVKKRQMIAYFFCQRQDMRLNNAVAVFRGLLYCLLNQYRSDVLPILQDQDDFFVHDYRGKESYWILQTLLVKVLSSLAHHRPILFIDALDECVDGQEELLNFLDEDVVQTSARWLISSRNEPQIQRSLSQSNVSRTSLEIHAQEVDQAVGRFIDAQVAKLFGNERDQDLFRTVVDYLHQNAQGTFLWVSLVCQELKKVPRRKMRAQLLLLPAGLKELYSAMLTKIEVMDDLQDSENCIRILRFVVISQEPPELPQIRDIVDLEDAFDSSPMSLEDLEELLEECASLLVVSDEKRVTLVHQSAADFFLTGKGREMIFSKGLVHEHQSTGRRLIHIMGRALKQDICDLGQPDVEVSDVTTEKVAVHITSSVRYACEFWIDHLLLQDVSSEIAASVLEFLQEHLLYWLEAMSLIGKTHRIVQALTEAMQRVQSIKATELFEFIEDANQFYMAFSVIITKAPLQIYYSALNFSPTKSIIRQIFKNHCLHPVSVSGLSESWSACQLTFEEYGLSIESIVFSPDGSKIASSARGAAIRIWDTGSGVCLIAFQDDSELARALAFSPDGLRLASLEIGGKIRIWDAQSGAYQQTLDAMADVTPRRGLYVDRLNLLFSPDGLRLISASEATTTLYMWDVQSGEQLNTFEASSFIHCIVASPDTSKLACGLNHGIVRILDLENGEWCCELAGHPELIFDIAFTPDDLKLAAATEHEIWIWDLQSESHVATLKGHSETVTSVAFFDTSRLVSASYDTTIRVWSLQSEACERVHRGHSDEINIIAMAPDGQRFASASEDQTIRIWNVASDSHPQNAVQSHSGPIHRMTISPDGTKLASASNDGTVRIWHTQTGTCFQILDGNNGPVHGVAFLSGGSQLASTCVDGSIRIWSTQTWSCSTVVEGHMGRIMDMASSLDGKKLASGSTDCTVRIWDAEQQVHEQTLKHPNSVYDVQFSPDGSKVASITSSQSLFVWDLRTGTRQHEIKLDLDPATIEFSPANLKLALGSLNRWVRIYDLQSGALTVEFESRSSCQGIFFTDEQSLTIGGDCVSLDLAEGKPRFLVGRRRKECWPRSIIYAEGQEWICDSSGRLIWLPTEYRKVPYEAKTAVSHGSVLAIGNVSGKVTIFSAQESPQS